MLKTKFMHHLEAMVLIDIDLSSVFSMENELLRPFHNLSCFPKL